MSEKTTHPRPSVASLAAQVAELSDQNRKLSEENRALRSAVDQTNGRIAEQREWIRETLAEKLGEAESRLCREHGRRDELLRSQLQQLLDTNGEQIRLLMEASDILREALLETSEDVEAVGREAEDAKIRAESAVARVEALLGSPQAATNLLDHLDHRLGMIELRQDELDRQIVGFVVHAGGQAALPRAEPPVAAAPSDRPDAVFHVDGLIPVFGGEIGGQPCPVCDARELHVFLDVGRDFSNWIKKRLKDGGFIRDQDYVEVFATTGENPLGGRPAIDKEGDLQAIDSSARQIWRAPKSNTYGQEKIDYHLTLETAKHIGMMEKNEKGHEVRRYFLDCERKLLERQNPANAPSATLPAIATPTPMETPAENPEAAPDFAYTLGDPLYLACIGLSKRPEVRASCLGDWTQTYYPTDRAVQRDGRVLAHLLRNVPRGETPWPFTLCELAGLIGLHSSDLKDALRRFESRGFLTVEKIGKPGKPGPTFELRLHWTNLFAAARETGADIEALADAALKALSG